MMTELTCRDCRHFACCMESSRMYPCKDFEPRKERHDRRRMDPVS